MKNDLSPSYLASLLAALSLIDSQFSFGRGHQACHLIVRLSVGHVFSALVVTLRTSCACGVSVEVVVRPADSGFLVPKTHALGERGHH